METLPFQNLYTYFHIEKVCRAHSSAWLERPAHNRSAGGSNPLGPKLYSAPWTSVKDFIKSRRQQIDNDFVTLIRYVIEKVE